MKKVIRLTESELHKIVKNTVNRILREAEEPNWTKSAHKDRYEFDKNLERDPYMGYYDTYYDDGYDEYNDEMDNLLSTKKGQMDFDFDSLDLDDASRIGTKEYVGTGGFNGKYGFGGRNGEAYQDALNQLKWRNHKNDWDDNEIESGNRMKKRWLKGKDL